MIQDDIAYYCQKCLAANPFGQELCARCGTPLMLVVEPRTTRFDNAELDASTEEHIIERISATESRIGRLTDKLEHGLDLLLKHAQNSFYDHLLLEALVDLLVESDVIDPAKLNEMMEVRTEREAENQSTSKRLATLREKIISKFSGESKTEFEKEVIEGFDLIEKCEIDRAVRRLENAATISPDNLLLHVFIGEYFFREGKMTLACDYLLRSLSADPGNMKVCVVLALLLCEEGVAQRAETLLANVAIRGPGTFTLHFTRGRLFAALDRWSDALAEFKRAVSIRPMVETQYAVGCAYFMLGRDRMALRFLREAASEDADFAEARYMIGMVLLRQGESDQAHREFESIGFVLSKKPKQKRNRAPRETELQTPPLPQFFSTLDTARRNLVTRGDNRITKALFEDSLAALDQVYDEW